MVKVAQSNKFMRGSSSFGMNQKDTAEHKSPHFLEQKTHPSFALRMFLSATRKQRSSSKVGSCFAWSVQGQRRGTLDGFIFFSVKKPDSLGEKNGERNQKKLLSREFRLLNRFFFYPEWGDWKILCFFNYMPDLGEPTNVSKPKIGKGKSASSKSAGAGNGRFVRSQEVLSNHPRLDGFASLRKSSMLHKHKAFTMWFSLDFCVGSTSGGGVTISLVMLVGFYCSPVQLLSCKQGCY